MADRSPACREHTRSSCLRTATALVALPSLERLASSRAVPSLSRRSQRFTFAHRLRRRDCASTVRTCNHDACVVQYCCALCAGYWGQDIQACDALSYDSVHAMPGCMTRTPHAHTVLCLRVDKLVFSLRVLRCAQNSFARILRLAVRQTLPCMRRRWAYQSYAPAVFKRDAGWMRGQS